VSSFGDDNLLPIGSKSATRRFIWTHMHILGLLNEHILDPSHLYKEKPHQTDGGIHFFQPQNQNA